MRKEILVDGVKKKVGEALGQFNAVLFLPQMMQVIEGAPDERRRYLNLAISQVYPIYAASLSEYGQVLSQRNALLKNVQERGSGMAGAAEQLAYWDERLSLYGAQIIHHRIRRTFTKTCPAARKFCAWITSHPMIPYRLNPARFS